VGTSYCGGVPTGGRSWSRDCATRSLRDADRRIGASRPQFRRAATGRSRIPSCRAVHK
jgi:hypothetical protein